MSVILTTLAIALFGALLIGSVVIDSIRQRMGGGNLTYPTRDAINAELSEADREKIKATQDIANEIFEGNLVDKLKNSSKMERIKLIDEFANRVAQEYGLDDIEIDITVDKVNSCGYYNYQDKKAIFNVLTLTAEGVDDNSEEFEYYARDIVDTIVHELRHAVQRKSLSENDFWNIDDERKAQWAENFDNYIRPEINMRGYANQPVEADAVTFAREVMKGVL